MNLRVAILLTSLVGNILLGAILSRNHSSAVSPPANSEQSKENSSASSATSREGKSGEANLSGASVESYSANSDFHWSQLESNDYKKYIAALRSFGVPEKTIRDIIIADVNKLYRPKFAPLRPPKKSEKEKNEKFWESRNRWYGGPDRDMTKEQREQMHALQKEQSELIKELLGKDVYQEMAKDSGYPDYMEQQFGKLTDAQREKVQEMQQRFGEAQSDIQRKTEGFYDQDTQNEIKKLHRKLHDELATVLTPEQVEEYELRSSDTAQQMKWQLSYFEPDEKEFRAIFKYKESQGDMNPLRNPDDDAPKLSADERKALAEKQKAVTEEFEKSLDPERLKEYKLQEDYAYRNLFEAGVSKENVFKVADMKTQTEDAAKKIRQDKTMTSEQRTETLKAIRVETEKELASLLGERRAKAYANNGGWWLRNIAPSNN